jgi:hypothetical protein
MADASEQQIGQHHEINEPRAAAWTVRAARSRSVGELPLGLPALSAHSPHGLLRPIGKSPRRAAYGGGGTDGYRSGDDRARRASGSAACIERGALNARNVWPA